MDIEEIKIPVPWGFIAAKAWGNKNNPPIILAHGWSDNANSFDRLIPLLPDCYYYICIDLPSHGRSSPLQVSLVLHSLDLVIIFKFLHDYLKRKLIIIAHSLGGMLATMFTQFYPECVEKLVILDTFYFYPHTPLNSIKELRRKFTSMHKILIKFNNKPRIYTKEEAIHRTAVSRITPIPKKTAEILTERNLTSIENGKYIHNIPSYMNYLIFAPYDLNGLVKIVKNYPIRCPHLIIMSHATSLTQLAYTKILKEYKKNVNFEIHYVKGTHEVHLENPERVAPIISKFLNKHNSKL